MKLLHKNTEEAAAAAYDKAAIAYKGQRAFTNFPRSNYAEHFQQQAQQQPSLQQPLQYPQQQQMQINEVSMDDLFESMNNTNDELRDGHDHQDSVGKITESLGIDLDAIFAEIEGKEYAATDGMNNNPSFQHSASSSAAPAPVFDDYPYFPGGQSM